MSDEYLDGIMKKIKLTPEQVAEIAKRYAKYELQTHGRLAADIAALLASHASLVAELKSREWRTDWENASKDGWIAGCNEHGWFKMQWVEGYGWAAYGRLAEPTHFMIITPPSGN